MKPYYSDDHVTLYHGDCLDVLATLPDESVHAVVTDPPYGIRFMGQAWDGADIVEKAAQRQSQADMPDDGKAGANGGYRSASTEAGRYDLTANAAFGQWCESWARECLRVLKPGGHMLAFGGSRTWHRLASAVEDAGFEIRDSIAWLYSEGFPKSHNVGAATERLDPHADRGLYDGLGTALKPAFEPIVAGRKPFDGTVAATVLEHETGALNIDACRTTAPSGRWPTNVLLDESASERLNAETGPRRPAGNKNPITRSTKGGYGGGWGTGEFGLHPAMNDGDDTSVSRFFPVFRYERKAPARERPEVDGVKHPTVKPLALMQWLVRLVTPPSGVVLEPFAGSGTTAEACVMEGFRCITIEREADYLPLIVSRLSKPIQQGLDFGEAS